MSRRQLEQYIGDISDDEDEQEDSSQEDVAVVDVKDPTAVADTKKKEQVSEEGSVKEQRPELPVPTEDSSSPDAKCEQSVETPPTVRTEAADDFAKRPTAESVSKSEGQLSEGCLVNDQSSEPPALTGDTSSPDEECERSPDTPPKFGIDFDAEGVP